MIDFLALPAGALIGFLVQMVVTIGLVVGAAVILLRAWRQGAEERRKAAEESASRHPQA